MPSMKGFAPAVKREMAGAERTAGPAAEKAGKGLGSRLVSGIKTTAKVGAIAAGVAVGGAVVSGFRSAISQQTAEKTLEGLYGSAKKAEATMKGLAKVSSTSPIEYDAYTKAAESLAYAGVEGKRAIGILKNVGLAITAAGGSSENMDRATDAVLKMVNAGKVQLDTLQQLSDAGVPILSGLSKHLGVSMEKVNTMASKGKIGLEDVLSVMQHATGDTFKQMKAAGQEASQSFGNQWKIAKDNVKNALGRVMMPAIEGLTPALKRIGQEAPGAIQGIADAVTPVAQRISAKLAAIDWGSMLASARTGLDKGVQALRPVFDAIVDFFHDVVASARIVAPAIGSIVTALKPMATWLAKLALGGLVAALRALGPLLKTVAAWFAKLAEHKTLVQIIAGLTAGIFGLVKAIKLLRAVGGGISTAFGRIKGGVDAVRDGFTKTKRVIGDAKAGIQLYGEAAKNGIGKATTAIKDYSKVAGRGIADGAKWVVQQSKRVALLAKEGLLWTANKVKLLAYAAAQKVVAAATKVWTVLQRGLNMVMRANPIGLVITAITALVAVLIWFFTKTKLGRKIIAAAWAGIKKAIQAVADWFTKKVWPSLKRVITALGAAFKAVGRVIAKAWQAIRKAISTAWTRVIRPALEALWRFIQKVLIPIIRTLWSKVVRPVFKAIGKAIEATWKRVIKPVIQGWLKIFKDVLFPVLRALWSKVVRPVFKGISKTISGVWKNGIKPVFEALKNFVTQTLPKAFRAGRDAIRRIWNGLKNIVKAPVNFIIGTVYNNGIRKLFNALPLPDKWKLPKIAKFRRGGPVTGGQTGRDSVPALMMPGEHVLTAAEVRKLGGQAAVYRMRELIRSGGLTVKEIVKDKPTTSSSGKRQGDIGWPAKNENVPGFAKGGGLTQKQIDRALAFSRRQVGKPYIWGGVGPNGYDCSGMMSAVTNVLMGRNPYSRVGTSSTFPWAGFKPGWGEWTIGAFTGSPGHVAGTLAGTNIESTNGSVRMGAAARGAGDSLFTRIAHLGVGGNMFAGVSTSASGTAISPMDQVIDSFGGTVRKWKKALTAVPNFIGKIRDSMRKAGESPIWQMFKAMLSNLGAKTVDWFNDKIPDWGPIPDNPIPNPFGSADMKPIDWSQIGSAMTSGAGGAASGSAQKYAKSLLANYGWGANQWGPLKALWQKESGWNPNADNPTSSAYGIPQMMMSAHSLPADYKSNFRTQVRVGLRYIKQRYGSPARAWAHSVASNWYGDGLTGGIFTQPTTIGVGERGPERVDITPLASGLGRTGIKASQQVARYGRYAAATGDDGRNSRGRRFDLTITNWDEGTGYMAEIAQEEIAGDADLDGQIARATR